jgi:hypothetical protein
VLFLRSRISTCCSVGDSYSFLPMQVNQRSMLENPYSDLTRIQCQHNLTSYLMHQREKQSESSLSASSSADSEDPFHLGFTLGPSTESVCFPPRPWHLRLWRLLFMGLSVSDMVTHLLESWLVVQACLTSAHPFRSP